MTSGHDDEQGRRLEQSEQSEQTTDAGQANDAALEPSTVAVDPDNVAVDPDNAALEPDSAADAEDEQDEYTAELLRRALREGPRPAGSLLPKVQERIRIRTRGRYYRDRWSQTRDPIPILLMVALCLLIVAAAIFLVLQPLVGEIETVEVPDAPPDLMTAPRQTDDAAQHDDERAAGANGDTATEPASAPGGTAND